MFEFVRTIAFLASGPMGSAREDKMAPFPAVMALGDSWVHVGGPDRGNMTP